jgi:branched-subunit amino acid transport protein
MTTWIVVLAVGAGSFLFRVGPLLLLERKPLGATSDRMIRHAGTAAITGLIAMSTAHSASSGHALAALLAVAVALGLAARRASMLRTVLCGGAVYVIATFAANLMAR